MCMLVKRIFVEESIEQSNSKTKRISFSFIEGLQLAWVYFKHGYVVVNFRSKILFGAMSIRLGLFHRVGLVMRSKSKVSKFRFRTKKKYIFKLNIIMSYFFLLVDVLKCRGDFVETILNVRQFKHFWIDCRELSKQIAVSLFEKDITVVFFIEHGIKFLGCFVLFN